MRAKWRTWAVVSCASASVLAGHASAFPLETSLAVGSVHADVGPRGASIEIGGGLAPGGETRLALARIGRPDDSLRDVPPARVHPTAEGADILRADLPGIVEWWRARPGGLEHGVTLEAPPPGVGRLSLELAVDGALRPRPGDQGTSIALLDAHGAVVATYAGLVVLDARGRTIPAAMASVEGGIRIEVDDRDARYPIVVDPLLSVEEATLAAASPALDDQLGSAVALSRDGSRAIVGAPYANAGGSDRGHARVFSRTGTSWAEEAVLLAPAGANNDHAGYAVALSDDGARAVVGAPDSDLGGLDAGRAYVYARTASVWSLEATLVSTTPAAGDRFGFAVALSGNGLVALVGAPGDDEGASPDAGSVHAFVRTTSWDAGTRTVIAGGRPIDTFGASVALSEDGNRALVGAPGWDGPTGASMDSGGAFAFVRVGPTSSVFSLEAVLRHAGAQPFDALGTAVALSGVADRALVGAPYAEVGGATDTGIAVVFGRAGISWTTEAVLTPVAGATDDYHGYSVALSRAGDRAVLGAPSRDTVRGLDAGRAALFERASSSWTAAGEWLASDAEGGDQLGFAVALAADGTRGIAGAYQDTTAAARAGTARIFRVSATLATGSPCTTGAECTSTFCFDGRCCGSDCSGGAGDCRACSVAAGASADGTCSVLSSGTICRASNGACDPAELCDGTSVACPPIDVRATAGTTCRAAAGGCDVAEVCDGSTSGCPGDGLAGSGVVCRSDVGDCDVEERCTGADAACPADVVSAAGAMCRAAVGPCDQPESCDGASGACPTDTFLPATTVCDATIAGPCDAPDHCTGASGNCPPAFLTATVCRAADGACDTEDVCSGSAAECPADAVEAAGMTCRASSEACDPAEACDGVAAACPADVTDCPMPLDGGERDAGGAADTGAVIDGGSTGLDAGPAMATTGCACSAAGRDGPPRSSPRSLGGLAAAALAAQLVRARRRARPAAPPSASGSGARR